MDKKPIDDRYHRFWIGFVAEKLIPVPWFFAAHFEHYIFRLPSREKSLRVYSYMITPATEGIIFLKNISSHPPHINLYSDLLCNLIRKKSVPSPVVSLVYQDLSVAAAATTTGKQMMAAYGIALDSLF